MHPTQRERGNARMEALDEWKALLLTESLAAEGHEGAKWVLKNIVWLRHVSVRLFFAVLESEDAAVDGQQTTHVAKSMCLCFPDEKPAEEEPADEKSAVKLEPVVKFEAQPEPPEDTLGVKSEHDVNEEVEDPPTPPA